MQSFGRPRPTSNPYIHLLDRELGRTEGIEHLRFSRRRALLGRYDALHFHWPETLFGGSTRAKAFARRLYATALVARLRLTRVAVVRTVHNVEPPSDLGPWERRILARIDRLTAHRIVLNTLTPAPGATLIPHGHFREWFAGAPLPAADARTLGFVGLVRRYKGVETLLAAFGDTAQSRPGWRLRVSGNPTSASLAEHVAERARQDPRIELDLRFLSEEDFAAAISRCAGIVLPYRFMHNSGALLAALSLNRPVLVPDNEVNRALRDEVGEGWLSLFSGELSADDLRAFMDRIDTSPPTGAPDLSAREWSVAGALHREAFARAVDARRGGARG